MIWITGMVVLVDSMRDVLKKLDVIGGFAKSRPWLYANLVLKNSMSKTA